MTKAWKRSELALSVIAATLALHLGAPPVLLDPQLQQMKFKQLINNLLLVEKQIIQN